MLQDLYNRLNLAVGSNIKVSTDSRSCPAGSVFFALKGEKFDGNQYAEQALNNGAALAVVDDTKYADNPRCIVVPDALKSLQTTAREYRDQFAIPVIAITGTNGKTTTKELTAACLSQKYRVHYTQGNLNNHIGVPLTLLSMPTDTQIAVIEMGASHPGDIKQLVDIADPTHGIITNVGKAHLLGFGSFEGVIATKCELYDYLRSTSGIAFVNADNDILSAKSAQILKVEYSHSKPTSITGHVADSTEFLTMEVMEHYCGNKTTVKSHLVGEYNAENVLAAICIATKFDVSLEQCKSAIEAYRPTNNRSMLVHTKHNTLIVDAYNANPTSMAAAVNNFAALDAEHKMLILGQMGELGQYQHEEHQKLVDLIEQKHFSDVIFVGAAFRTTNTSFPIFDTTEHLVEALVQHPITQRTILIKGSHSNRLETIKQYL